MELLYIWVEKYGCFRNREFLFNKNYDISLVGNTLHLKKLQDKICIYKSPIININVIAGKNGTGKSCLLELIQDISKISTNDTNRLSYFSNINTKIIFIFQSNDFIEIYSNKLNEIEISNYENLEYKPFDLDDINYKTEGSIYENKLGNKCQIQRYNNMINFNLGFSEISKTPIEKFDPVEHELHQTDYKNAVKLIHEMLQQVFLLKNVFDEIRKDMSTNIINTGFPYLYIDKFSLQGIYFAQDTFVDDILKSDDNPRKKLLKVFLGKSISNAKEENDRRGKNLVFSFNNSQKEIPRDNIYDKMTSYIQKIIDCLNEDYYDESMINKAYDEAVEYESTSLNNHYLSSIRKDIFELITLIYRLKLVEEVNCFKILSETKEDSEWLTDFILKHEIELNTKQQNDNEVTEKIICDFIAYVKEYDKNHNGSIIALELPDKIKTYLKEEYFNKNNEIEDIKEFRLCVAHKNQMDYLVGQKIEINQLIQNYISYIFDKGIWGRFGYSYSSISSGEMTSLLIFKKIFDYFSSGDITVFERPIIILLDEPNIALHPELERKFIYLLNKYTDKLVKKALEYSKNVKYKHINENKNIEEVYRKITVQYIITTHSPIMISDIPKSNIIFLEAGTEKNRDNQNKLKGTLANNIYEIMLNGMFVEKSIGEFSFEFIESVEKEIENIEKEYSIINNNARITDRINNIQSKIDLIGDCFIKKSLQSKLDTVKVKLIPEDTLLKRIREIEVMAYGNKDLKRKACFAMEEILKQMKEE